MTIELTNSEKYIGDLERNVQDAQQYIAELKAKNEQLRIELEDALLHSSNLDYELRFTQKELAKLQVPPVTPAFIQEQILELELSRKRNEASTPSEVDYERMEMEELALLEDPTFWEKRL